MDGTDRLDFLHRMSTNDVTSLAPFEVRSTVLTTSIAQIIDVVEILTLEGDLLLITSPGRTQIVQDWLRKHIFFQDEVSIEISPTDWSLWDFYGPDSFSAVESLFPAAEDLQMSRVSGVEGGFLWRLTAPLSGYRALLNQNLTDHLRTTTENGNSAEASYAAYQILRIEAGLPEFDREILEHSIPLEVGLRGAIHFEKGCYIGQEIIARMESRGKMARKLVGVCLEEEVEEGSAIHSGGKKIGEVTSIGHSPRLGWIGLAVVKTAAHKDNLSISIAQGNVQGRLVRLPFDPNGEDLQPCFARDATGRETNVYTA
jgi:aminomethyltransferase